MKILFTKNFSKQLQKLSKKEQESFFDTLALFCKNSRTVALEDHPLRGKHKGYRSINITGDLRAIYKKISDDGVVQFVAIGTHHQLYGT